MAAEFDPDGSPNIESAIRFLYRKSLHTDFIFISKDGTSHKVHRLIVAIHSPVLADMLFCEPQIDKIEVAHDNVALENMISYFYSGVLHLKDIHDIRQTKEIADEYKITELGRICRERLGKIEITVSNVLTVWEAAIEIGNEEKENKCYRLISENQETVFNSEHFLNLPFKRALKIFEKLKSMKMMTESAFLHSAITWLNRNKHVNGKKFLMEKTIIAHVSRDDYIDIVTTHENFFTGPEITAALRKIKNNHTAQEKPMNNSGKNEQHDIQVEILELQDLNEQVKELTDKKEKLSNEVLDLTKLVEDFTKQVENLNGQVTETEECLQHSLLEMETKQVEIQILTKQLKTMNLTLQEKTNKIEQLESEVKKLKEQINVFKSQSSATEESLQSSLNERDLQQEEIQSMTDQLKAMDLVVQEKTNKIDEFESEIKKLMKQINSSKSQSSKDSTQKLPQKLTIEILKHEDGVNVFNLEKRARITISDGIMSRSLQIAVDDILKKGPMGTVLEKKGSYTESNVNISYEGIYFMIRSLKVLEETFSPIQYVELLKAALHFQLKELAEKCIKRICLTSDYDPLFLDGLISLSYLTDKSMGLKGLAEFRDKCITLLTSDPLRVILHPNFINCSSDLIILLLQQIELKVKNESQLLLVIIAWLEAKPKERNLLRNTLLKNLAFQSISTSDFRYTVLHYPNFFHENEQKNILAYRNAVGSEIKFFRDNLPEWYNFKSRVLL